jgi:hypothetical protein
MGHGTLLARRPGFIAAANHRGELGCLEAAKAAMGIRAQHSMNSAVRHRPKRAASPAAHQINNLEGAIGSDTVKGEVKVDFYSCLSSHNAG